ncbi:MAG: transposase [Petrimonas sp.]|nr:transposase [Petrimonas sp.]
MPDYQELTTIGIDDWAYRKGKSYGTIIVNAINRRPVELLKSRDKEEVSDWLKEHNSIFYITRDRSSSYSNAIESGAPKAAQIADRFHLVKNLGDLLHMRYEWSIKPLKIVGWLTGRVFVKAKRITALYSVKSMKIEAIPYTTRIAIVLTIEDRSCLTEFMNLKSITTLKERLPRL